VRQSTRCSCPRGYCLPPVARVCPPRHRRPREGRRRPPNSSKGTPSASANFRPTSSMTPGCLPDSIRLIIDTLIPLSRARCLMLHPSRSRHWRSLSPRDGLAIHSLPSPSADIGFLRPDYCYLATPCAEYNAFCALCKEEMLRLRLPAYDGPSRVSVRNPSGYRAGVSGYHCGSCQGIRAALPGDTP
jgi:hypothetical protein